MTPDDRVEVTSGDVSVYYRFGGRAVAWRNNSGMRYVLADHLSSTHGETSSSQGEMGQRRYTPYGSDRSVAGANDIGDEERFTSQRRIDSGGGDALHELYHYGARWYLPGVGIFTQPDTIVPDFRNPQALNRFAYILNNPVRYTDPTGNYTQEELEEYLGKEWKTYYFDAEHGLFGKRDEFGKFLTSKDSTNLVTLRIIQASFSVLRAAVSAAREFGNLTRRADAVVGRVELGFRGGAGPALATNGSAHFVANLESGEFSYFEGLDIGGGLGGGAQMGSIQLGLAFDLPNNASYPTPYWGVSGSAGFIAGPAASLSGGFAWNPPSFDQTPTMIPAAGVAFGLGPFAQLTVNLSTAFELRRETATGTRWTPAIGDFIEETRRLLPW